MLEEYPKEIILKDSTQVTLRPMERSDEGKLLTFFERISEEDRWYLRDDVSDPQTIHRWVEELNYKRVIPILALTEDRIIGDATLHRRRYGSSHHVGKIRIVIDPDYRMKRLGTWMVLDLIQLATGTGLEKVVAEVAQEEAAAIQALRRLDFVCEGRIPELHKDPKGDLYDLLIMVKNLHPRWTDF